MKDKILIIDDVPEICSLLTMQLENEFEVHVANDGIQAIEAYQDHQYLLVLLDIEIPGMDGFEICQELNQIDKPRKPSLIFISGHDDDETTLRCFEMGADDFISKNTETSILNKKLKALVRYKRMVSALHQEEENLTELVNTTMLQASFYGSCLNLMADIQLADSEERIAQIVFSFMQSQGLKTAFSFSHDGQTNYFDQVNRLCSPIEKKVFTLLKDKGRIYEFSSRLVLNDQHVSLLIKQMPDSQSTQYGLLIDVLAKLVPAIEMRYRALINNRQLQLAQHSLQSTVSNIQMAVQEMQEERQKIIDDIVMKIGLSFHDMDFSDDQEQFLIKLIETSVMEQADNNDKFVSINQQLTQTLDSIHPETLTPQFTEDGDSGSGDIELF
ncbi:hypothetical protein C2869_17665 [Saccharobesus litoralis]|uniref:Response regulatory domain-containing protein n=1 Tax=Saccharobesus litoralis TaxID=2172099 RepID=A0A2S0VV86_9ALTE|nr:response regulator [Saccharobesus litoralis]AWB68131.1 hypothetical protein C2869_17665 [Saccharobesus litoralis]